MKNDHRKSGRDLNIDLNREQTAGSDDKLNRDIHKSLQSERFPDSSMTKDQRKDTEKVKEKDDSNIEELAADVEGTVGTRNTSSDPDDIAGVADLDKGLRRAKRH